MSKVNVELDIRAAAAVRQILFDSQKGYTTDPDSVPPRILEIREVISNLDRIISQVVDTL